MNITYILYKSTLINTLTKKFVGFKQKLAIRIVSIIDIKLQKNIFFLWLYSIDAKKL